MDNLIKVSDSELISLVKNKAQTERQLTLDVIDLLREIDKRKLHLKGGFSSLHEFCVLELKYSDGAAFRRIKAMRLAEQLPEVVKSIESGSLSLTTASQLQQVFENKAKEKKPMTAEEKTELFLQVQNQSRREVDRTIAKVCPEVIRIPERLRLVNQSQVKMEFVIEEKLFKKLEKLKVLTSHKNKTFMELLEYLVDKELKRCDPEARAGHPTASPAKSNIEQFNSASRYIPSAIRHFIWMRDQGRCTYTDPVTKRMCGSNHNLQYEHVQPFAMGGKNTADNLRLLCRNHNRLTAAGVYGPRKMDNFARGSV